MSLHIHQNIILYFEQCWLGAMVLLIRGLEWRMQIISCHVVNELISSCLLWQFGNIREVPYWAEVVESNVKSTLFCCNADFWQVRRIGLSWNLWCCSESISMKVWAIIKYIMKVMCRDFKKIGSNSFKDIQKSAKSPNFE